jgi:hypothetical protein
LSQELSAMQQNVQDLKSIIQEFEEEGIYFNMDIVHVPLHVMFTCIIRVCMHAEPSALFPEKKPWPVTSFPMNTMAELKEKTITMTKAETISAQPMATTGMSSHILSLQ